MKNTAMMIVFLCSVILLNAQALKSKEAEEAMKKILEPRASYTAADFGYKDIKIGDSLTSIASRYELIKNVHDIADKSEFFVKCGAEYAVVFPVNSDLLTVEKNDEKVALGLKEFGMTRTQVQSGAYDPIILTATTANREKITCQFSADGSLMRVEVAFLDQKISQQSIRDLLTQKYGMPASTTTMIAGLAVPKFVFANAGKGQTVSLYTRAGNTVVEYVDTQIAATHKRIVYDKSSSSVLHKSKGPTVKDF
ncbi:MAG: hypothetical protein AABZ39_03955 [Spirochaetota bacterium]